MQTENFLLIQNMKQIQLVENMEFPMIKYVLILSSKALEIVSLEEHYT